MMLDSPTIEHCLRESMAKNVRAAALLLLLILTTTILRANAEFPVPETPFQLSQGMAIKAYSEIIIDGTGDDPDWQRAEWSPPFVDIRGYDFEPAPRFETSIKMMWDDTYFYVLAWMEEPDLWATYDEHDMVIYHENDFEIFIDPDGDNHNYLELEINALGTTWDLMLTKPYRDNGQAIDSWEIPGLKSAVYLDGTLNDPSDVDVGWGVEWAIPWDVIYEVDSRGKRPGETHPSQMRVNFSRVEWKLDVVNGIYMKQSDPRSGESLPEDNWVWSSQGLIAMHYPERWGRVTMAFEPSQVSHGVWSKVDDELRESTMLCYYAQKKYYDENQRVYASKFKSLDLPKKPPYPGIEWPPEITWMRTGFQIVVYHKELELGMRVREDGRLINMPYHGTRALQYMRGVRPPSDSEQNPDGQ
jgi:Carbohydrate family 9 binding domain-like